MVHTLSALSFALVAAASASLIWSMLSANRAVIADALGLRAVALLPRTAGRRVRVRSVQSATQWAATRTAQVRRAA